MKKAKKEEPDNDGYIERIREMHKSFLIVLAIIIVIFGGTIIALLMA
jgi:hypothetical protein